MQQAKEERTASEPLEVKRNWFGGVLALRLERSIRLAQRSLGFTRRTDDTDGDSQSLPVCAKRGRTGSQLPVDLRAEGALLERRLPRVFLPPGLSTDAETLTGISSGWCWYVTLTHQVKN